MATRSKPKPTPMAAAFDAFAKANGKKRRRTPARVLARRLRNKKTRGATLFILAAVVAGLAFGVSRYAAVGAGALAAVVATVLVAFLVVCEAWPELAKWGYLNRRMLIPFAALALAGIPALLAIWSPRVAVFVGVAGLLGVAYSHLNLALRKADFSHARGYIPRQWLPIAYLETGWAVAAGKCGLIGPVLGVLLAGWLVWAGWFWFLNRTRTSHQLPLAKRWADTIANPDYEHIDTTHKLIGSKLVNPRSVPGGSAGTVVLPAGQKGSKVDGLTEVIASVYGVDVTAVTVDQPQGGGAGRRELYVLPRSALNRPIKWKGSDLDLEAFTSTVGTYIDGARVQYLWREWHDLISGTTGSGKSRLLDLLLATSRSSRGLIVDWVIDPQNGQSLPDWQDEVDWFASGVDEGMKMLKAARAVMYARNRILSQQVWEDSAGRQRKGVKQFVPTLEMPLLVVTIEEAHAILNDVEARQMVEDMAKMSRKCGIKLRIVTQVPTISQLGNSNVIRSMVASGNVFVLRTGARADSGFAFQGALQVDPVSIPRRMPDGATSAGLGFALGSESRQAPMRADFVEDPLDYIAGPVHVIDAASANAAGHAYAFQYALRTGMGQSDEPGVEPGVIEGEVIAEVVDQPAEEPTATVVRGPGGITCADRIKQIVKKEANRADNPHASVSRSDLAARLLGTWKLRQITNSIREMCEDPREPVWSDDGRNHLYYKEAA